MKILENSFQHFLHMRETLLKATLVEANSLLFDHNEYFLSNTEDICNHDRSSLPSLLKTPQEVV